jgi:thiol-disulfide isomerase/thioredoxin
MSKAQRVRAARRPSPSSKQPAVSSRLVWGGTAAVVAVIAVVVALLLATRPTTKVPPPAASASSTDRDAPAALVAAADAVGFRPNVEPGVGTIEDEPASAAGPPSTTALLPVGGAAPAFSLQTPTGETVTLRSRRGKAVLLEFFATWCPHCAAEAPHLQRIYRTLGAKDYAFVSIDADGETAPSVYAYHRYFGLGFPALLDPSDRPGSFTEPGAPGPVTRAYRVQSFPTFYVLDREGRVTWRSDGEQPDALLLRELRRAAGE